MFIFKCYRILDSNSILTHFNGRSEFDDFSELLSLLNVNFDVRKHKFIISAEEIQKKFTMLLNVDDKLINTAGTGG